MKLPVSNILAMRYYVNSANTRHFTDLASFQSFGEVSEWLMVPLSKSGLH